MTRRPIEPPCRSSHRPPDLFRCRKPLGPFRRPFRQPVRGLAAAPAGLVLAIALAGCAAGTPLGPEPEPVYRSATYVPGASAIICYRTLAAPDCYARPQPGPPNRVIAAYDELYPPPPPDEATEIPVEVVPTTGGGVPIIEHTPDGPRPILRPER